MPEFLYSAAPQICPPGVREQRLGCAGLESVGHDPKNRQESIIYFHTQLFFFNILKTTASTHSCQAAHEKANLKKKLYFPILLFCERCNECVYHMEMRKNLLEKLRKYGISLWVFFFFSRFRQESQLQFLGCVC